MASPTRWTQGWVSSGSWWWTGKPGMLWSMGLQRVRIDWVTELNWNNTWEEECPVRNYAMDQEMGWAAYKAWKRSHVVSHQSPLNITEMFISGDCLKSGQKRTHISASNKILWSKMWPSIPFIKRWDLCSFILNLGGSWPQKWCCVNFLCQVIKKKYSFCLGLLEHMLWKKPAPK